MNTKEILTQVKVVITAIDKWDDTAISVLKALAGLSFAPAWLKTAAFVVEKYEKLIIEKGSTAIDFIISLLGGMEKAEEHGEKGIFESKEEKHEAKLNVALEEVKPLLQEEEKEEDVLDKIEGVTEKVSGIIGVINSFKGLF